MHGNPVLSLMEIQWNKIDFFSTATNVKVVFTYHQTKATLASYFLCPTLPLVPLTHTFAANKNNSKHNKQKTLDNDVALRRRIDLSPSDWAYMFCLMPTDLLTLPTWHACVFVVFLLLFTHTYICIRIYLYIVFDLLGLCHRICHQSAPHKCNDVLHLLHDSQSRGASTNTQRHTCIATLVWGLSMSLAFEM